MLVKKLLDGMRKSKSYVRFIDGGVGVDMNELIHDKDFREAVKGIGEIPLDNPKSKDSKN